ncbi:MAG: aromatic amino acid lyase, partial [Pyrinomonadaceae bacterium]
MKTQNNIPVSIAGNNLSIKQSVSVACGAEVIFSPDAYAAVQASCNYVRSILQAGQTIYGVNTGFGALSDVRIGSDELSDLQLNLVRS